MCALYLSNSGRSLTFVIYQLDSFMNSIETFKRCLNINLVVEGSALIALLVPATGESFRSILFGSPDFTFPIVLWAVCLAAFAVAAAYAIASLSSAPKGKGALSKSVIAAQVRPTLALFATYHVCLSAVGIQLMFNALTGTGKLLLVPFALPLELPPVVERALIPGSLLLLHGGLAVLSAAATHTASRDIAANKE